MKFDWKVGNKYKNRAGEIVTMIGTEYGDTVILEDAKRTVSRVWMCNGCQNKDPHTYPWPVDVMSEVKDWTVGTIYIAKACLYGGYKYQLVAINPEHERPYVMRFGVSKLDMVACFTEEQLRQRQLELPPTKVKVRLAFVDGDIYSATKRDSFISPLPHNAIVRDVEVEL